MKYKQNQVIRLNPDAEVSLSYKNGAPPARFIKNELWMVDAVEDDGQHGQMLNISTFEPVGNINAGSYCAYVYSDDVKEVVEVYRRKTESCIQLKPLLEIDNYMYSRNFK